MNTMELTGLPAYDFWNGVFDRPCDNVNGMKLDLIEKKDSFVVSAHVPGIPKDNIKIIFENDVLTVAVSYCSERKRDDERIHFKECVKSSSSRSIRFQHGKVDYKNITAKYVDGELCIVLQFHENVTNETVKVDID